MTSAPGRPASTDRRGWIGLLTLFTIAGLAETIFYGQTNAFTPKRRLTGGGTGASC